VLDLFTRFKNHLRAASLALIASALLVSCGGGGGSSSSPIVTAPLTLSLPTNYVLKWSDEFSVSGAPSSVWQYDLGAPLLGGTVWGNSEQQYYTSNANNVAVVNGELVIQPVAGLPSGAPTNLNLLASSARINTDTASYYSALNSTPYGFYEIRAKIPCTAGAWPAIWMMGKTGAWPARGEIDIMEWFGRYFAAAPNQVQSGVHTDSNSGANSIYQKANVTTMCSQYNLFQMHWSANEILIGVNGVSTLSYKKPANANSSNWPFDQPAHVILNVAVGGNLGGIVNTSDIASMTMKVDYVKVWQPVP
jgi:beta-glucanase (GH16 family)